MIPSIFRSVLKVVLRFQSLRIIALTVAYAAAIFASITFAYLLRFDFGTQDWLTTDFLSASVTVVCVQLLCMFAFHQFDGLLSYFSTPDLKRLMLACGVAVLIIGVLRLAFGVVLAPPRGVILMHYFLSVVALGGLRLSFRNIRRIVYKTNERKQGRVRRVAIVGAGDCGAALVKDLLSKPWLALKPVALFDDARSSTASVHGVTVAGHTDRISEFKSKLELDEIIIALPSAPPKRVREILKLGRDAGLPCRTVPSLCQLATGHVSVSNIRPVEIHDLLGRPPVEMKDEAVREEIQGRVVMVTGAGGSIGSELCRQILSFGPSKLVLVERSEPLLFAIEQELRGEFNAAPVRPVVGDITRRGRMREIFRRFRPDIVFHAAAHKHVPMMEMQPDEAIRNNVFGTALLADLAIEYAVERFIHISTDKAVNPTNVMGATKRLAEMYLQSLSTRPTRTKFMAVRFGNVLGSSGSVVPTFKRQIAAGGPVTVTHPEVTRYFMTIPEAVSLVLQSSTLGKGGDIFVLDMGNPVRIVDLAMQMIALSGLTPNKDIEIAFTGLRPGEKLYEELSHGGESVTPTGHPKIARLVASPLHHSYVGAFLSELLEAIGDGDVDAAELKAMLARMLPEYTPFLPDDSKRSDGSASASTTMPRDAVGAVAARG
jgi:FlaA1/EpsC-like NDP-sugar epimerase